MQELLKEELSIVCLHLQVNIDVTYATFEVPLIEADFKLISLFNSSMFLLVDEFLSQIDENKDDEDHELTAEKSQMQKKVQTKHKIK